MAWIESHQQLRDHPKVIRLARMLDVNRREAVGMLHYLWWWALDHAEDGDLTEYEAEDLADACDYGGDPHLLVKALLECGPGERPGFIEDAPGERVVLHDWWQYAGKLVDRRRKDRERKAKSSSEEVPKDSDGVPAEVAPIPFATQPNPTEPDRTEPEPSSALERREDVDRLCDLLADLIEANGSKRPTVTKAWRDAARLMLDKDERDPVKAENLIRWCQADDFWRSNVLSMPTFREKYDQLRLKALDSTKKATPVRTTPQSRTAENAARMRQALRGNA